MCNKSNNCNWGKTLLTIEIFPEESRIIFLQFSVFGSGGGFLVILYFLLQRDLLSWILCDSYNITLPEFWGWGKGWRYKNVLFETNKI